MNSAISDYEAVERVKTGDSTSYDILANRHDRRLRRLAQRYLRNDADAEEVVQEAHLLAFTRIGQFAGRSSFLSWISAITVNQALMRLRGGKFSSTGGEVDFDLMPAPGNNPEQEAIERDMSENVEGALQDLPAAYRAVFSLREVDSLNTAETSDRLGLSQACVKTRLQRARGMLRGSLARKGVLTRGSRSQNFTAN